MDQRDDAKETKTIQRTGARGLNKMRKTHCGSRK
jgi:hypothetical protein